jgi:hypothetical protein
MGDQNKYSEDVKNFFFNEKNKQIRKELKDKFGMEYSEESEDAPPEIINEFLEHVKEFEEAWENTESKKIKEMLGFPEFKKTDRISSEDLETAISEVLAVYSDYNINISVIEEDEVSNLQYYKFLTEELPEHETDFLPAKGMTLNFIYEEFHPSNKLDAKNIIEWMLPYLFAKEKNEIKSFISKNNLTFNGITKTPDDFVEELLVLFEGFEENADKKIIFTGFEFNGQFSGKVETEFLLERKFHRNNTDSKEYKSVKLLFFLKRNDYDNFDITGCIVK